MDVLTAISFCSGYEGLGLGLKRAIPNLRTICYVEGETYAVANLVAKIKEGKLDDAPIWDDVKTFDPKPFAGMVDIIHSGYPCQPFSHAGKRKGTDDPRHLWPYILKHVRAIRPVRCFFENVGGHLSLGFEEVAQSLRDLGYKVEAGLFTAEEVGAPHRRERLFILAESSGVRRRGRDNGEPARQGRPLQAEGSSELAKPECSRYIHGESQEQSTERRLDAQREPNSDSQLADTDTGWEPQPQGVFGNERGRIVNGSEKELVDSNSNGRQGLGQTKAAGKDDKGGRQECSPELRALRTGDEAGGLPENETGSTELADSNGKGLERGETARNPKGQRQNLDQQFAGYDCWPARLGQEQYEWEEPRTLLSYNDYSLLKGYVKKYKTRLTVGQAIAMADAKAEYETEPGMGRATSRPNFRVDRLRLLGNGVVPRQAEKAIRILLRTVE